jgi:hypothetical protein
VQTVIPIACAPLFFGERWPTGLVAQALLVGGMALTVLGVVIISWPRREAPAVPAVRVERGWATFLRQHRPFVVVELLVLGAALTLDVIVTLHPAPLPGDVGSVLDLQRLLLPHKALTLWLEQVSTVTWPITALETILAAVALLLLLHRWLYVGKNHRTAAPRRPAKRIPTKVC